MIPADKILPITQVKRELMSLLKNLGHTGGVIAITKDGKATGVLMSAEEYEGLLETIEILHDQSMIRSLHKALKELRSEKSYTHKEVFGE